MKVRIELIEDLQEDEIIIQCRGFNDDIQKIQQSIMEIVARAPAITYYKNSQEYFVKSESILFFETDGETVFAHTAEDAYRVKFRLYELEQLLPQAFVRVSKSTILNIRQIYSIDRSITSSSLITFMKSHKQVYASRMYYKNLKQRLDERRQYEK